MQYFFTSDEHYGHTNIIKYCNRPFSSVEEMDKIIINNHNKIVKKNDIVIHAGDFTLCNTIKALQYISKLNGEHIFLKGSHDKWMDNKSSIMIFEKTINKQFIVICHYAMRTWAKSHYNSWQLHGHSHGNLYSIGKQLDIGVDNNNFFPFSFEQIKKIMEKKEDNFNLIIKH